MRKGFRPFVTTIGVLVVLLVLAGTANFMQFAHASASGKWSLTGSMSISRSLFTLTQLHNGMVLAAGGQDSLGNPLSSAELYNPTTGTWTPTGSMTIARFSHTATLLPNGEVLVAGGSCSYTYCSSLASAEFYNPATGKWTPTGSMQVARENHSATLLANGNILVAGGDDGNNPPSIITAIASAELYNPATGLWTLTGSMHAARFNHSAVHLANGSVLVVGGDNGGGSAAGDANSLGPNSPCFCPRGIASAEIYNPAKGIWKTTGSMNRPRTLFTAISIPDGTFRVLVAGGIQCHLYSGSCHAYNSAEIYTPATGTWKFTANMHVARDDYGAAQMSGGTGQVIISGGVNQNKNPLLTEVFTVSSGTWSVQGYMRNIHVTQRDLLMHAGNVLAVGGGTATAEIYTP